MKVCHLVKYYYPATGGIESHVLTLAKKQSESGLDVHVVCVNHLDENGRDTTWNTFAKTKTSSECSNKINLTRVGKIGTLAKFDICPGLIKLGSWIKSWRVNLMHFHAPNPTMAISLWPIINRCRYVITHHSDIVKQAKLKQIIKPINRQIYKKSSAIIVSSQEYAESSPELTLFKQKLCVVPYGIDLKKYVRPEPKLLERSKEIKEQYGDPIWLSVGRHVYYKSIDIAVRAIRSLPGKLICVGDGPLKGELIKLTEDLKVNDKVVFVNNVNDEELISLYHAATALLFPSSARSEAFGIVQIEAMACGCPVINCNINGSGVTWVSQHEQSGLTVPINNVDALAHAAMRLFKDEKLRMKLSQGARERALKEFDDSLMTQRILNIYQQVI